MVLLCPVNVLTTLIVSRSTTTTSNVIRAIASRLLKGREVCQGCVRGVSGVCQGCVRGVSGVCNGRSGLRGVYGLVSGV